MNGLSTVERRFRSIEELGARMLRSIGDGVIGTDGTDRISFINPAAEQLTGWPAHEAIGRSFDAVFRIVCANGGMPLESPLTMVHRERRCVTLEGRPLLVRRDGTKLPIADSAAPLQLEDGTIDGVVLVFRDASCDRRESQRQTLLAGAAMQLGSSLELESTLARVTELVVAELAEECTIHLLEDGAARNVAHARARSNAKAEETHIPLRARDRVVGGMTVSLRSHGAQQDELDLATLVTLAERISAAIETAHLYQQAQAASRAKDEFLAMLGHELRNPLAPIVSALDLIRRHGAPPFERELAVIDRQLRHVVRLVDDLLDVSRIAAGRVQLQRDRVDISEAVLCAIERAQPLIEQRKHRLAVDCPNGLVVCGDFDRLTQAVTNLIVNAAKYTPVGGHIAVIAERRGERAVVRVRDDGMGIAPEMLSRVFELFVQDARSIDRSQGGLGIGLAIVRAIIRGHDGEVSAKSGGPGKGTEFLVELPLRKMDPHPEPAVDAPPSSRGRVLVVDDNVDAAQLLAASLSLLGYETHEAYDAETALALAERLRPSAALLNIGLPVIDGYELARRLRAFGEMQLIAVTGYGQPSDRERSRAAGFDAHLVKPVAIDAVARLLDGGPSHSP